MLLHLKRIGHLNISRPSYTTITDSTAFLLFGSDKVAPDNYIYEHAPNTDATVWGDDFEDGDISEWVSDGTQNWALSSTTHAGIWSFAYTWGYNQDTRAIPPEIYSQ